MKPRLDSLKYRLVDQRIDCDKANRSLYGPDSDADRDSEKNGYGSMNLGHDPRAVANAMIAFAALRDIPLWNVSIQKLLYFAHASFLVRKNRPLVKGCFEAWEFGPVSRPVYDALKKYGREPVNLPITRTDPFSGETTQPAMSSDIEAVDEVESVMRTMSHLSPSQLIRLSHVDEGAWSVVWNKSKTGATLGNRITDELTVERYSRLKISLSNCNSEGGIDEAAPFAGD